MSTWSNMDLREFHESGLLFWANHQTFWPLGLALAITRTEDGYEPYLRLLRVDPHDVIVSGDVMAMEAAAFDRALAWIANRLSLLPVEPKSAAEAVVAAATMCASCLGKTWEYKKGGKTRCLVCQGSGIAPGFEVELV